MHVQSSFLDCLIEETHPGIHAKEDRDVRLFVSAVCIKIVMLNILPCKDYL